MPAADSRQAALCVATSPLAGCHGPWAQWSRQVAMLIRLPGGSQARQGADRPTGAQPLADQVVLDQAVGPVSNSDVAPLRGRIQSLSKGRGFARSSAPLGSGRETRRRGLAGTSNRQGRTLVIRVGGVSGVFSGKVSGDHVRRSPLPQLERSRELVATCWPRPAARTRPRRRARTR
jgi:hypothetical protein